MRTYGQHCALARALDVIGDRWSLLIVRELMIRDARFGELRRGLPGIASNLLTDRLRELEAERVVEAVATDGVVHYRLTSRGRALEPVLHGLIRWGAPSMRAEPSGDQEQGHWLVMAADALVDSAAFRGTTPLVVQFDCNGELLWLRLSPGSHEVGLGYAPDPDVTISGSMHQCLGALLRFPVDPGAEIVGDIKRLRDVAKRVATE